jgi:hypothetical protein
MCPASPAEVVFHAAPSDRQRLRDRDFDATPYHGIARVDSIRRPGATTFGGRINAFVIDMHGLNQFRPNKTT